MLKRVICAIALLAGPAAAQVPAAQAPVAQSNQAAFDAAQAAFEKADWAAATTGFRDLLTRMKPTAHAIPTIHARLAVALSRSGQVKAAAAEATIAIEDFGKQGVTKDGYLASVYALRGDDQRALFENEQAITSYQAAIAAATDASDNRVLIYGARIGLSFAAMTTKPDVAAAALDTELADTAFFARLDKMEQAKLLSNRALVELNRGNPKAAARFIEKSLDLAGRITERVNLAQVGIRGNAALIYAQLGREDDVRQYLTYSGAGHLPSGDWLQGADMPLPVCDTDIAPTDVAVIEFAIGTDGRTIGAAAIYASRPGVIGTVFASSVKQWRWRPAAVAKLSLFWRASVRMELRCVKRPEPIHLVDSFRNASEQWLAQGGTVIALDDPAAVMPTENPANPSATIARLLLTLIQATSEKTSTQAYAALEPQLIAAHAPAAVRAYAAFQNIQDNGPLRSPGGTARAAKLAALADRFAGDAAAARETAWLRTEAALQLEANGALVNAKDGMQKVVALSPQILGADDPIRSLALLHLSLIDKRGGKAAEADNRLTAAGIDSDQCSLLDVRPVARNTAISSSVFPSEAVRWHFEGRVSEAFDIAADGSVADVRTVISYPPFVFGPTTEKAVRQFHYLPPTLGDQPLGCTGQTVNVRFVLPD